MSCPEGYRERTVSTSMLEPGDLIYDSGERWEIMVPPPWIEVGRIEKGNNGVSDITIVWFKGRSHPEKWNPHYNWRIYRKEISNGHEMEKGNEGD